jgi:hypothetical protein
VGRWPGRGRGERESKAVEGRDVEERGERD